MSVAHTLKADDAKKNMGQEMGLAGPAVVCQRRPREGDRNKSELCRPSVPAASYVMEVLRNVLYAEKESVGSLYFINKLFLLNPTSQTDGTEHTAQHWHYGRFTPDKSKFCSFEVHL